MAAALGLGRGIVEAPVKAGLFRGERVLVGKTEAALRLALPPRRVALVELEPELAGEPGADVAIGRMQPFAAEIQRVGRAAAIGMSPAAEPIAGFQEEDGQAAGSCRAPGRDAGGACADDDQVGAAGRECHGGKVVGDAPFVILRPSPFEPRPRGGLRCRCAERPFHRPQSNDDEDDPGSSYPSALTWRQSCWILR